MKRYREHWWEFWRPVLPLEIKILAKGAEGIITIGNREHPFSNSEVKEFSDRIEKFLTNSKIVIVNGSFCTVNTRRKK